MNNFFAQSGSINPKQNTIELETNRILTRTTVSGVKSAENKESNIAPAVNKRKAAINNFPFNLMDLSVDFNDSKANFKPVIKTMARSEILKIAEKSLKLQ